MKILDIPQSGSVAGVTSSRNRYGQYRRTRAIPVNPRSGFQGVVRARLSVSAAAWRTLTANQRAGWNDLAASTPKVDSLGQTSPMTGFGCYCMVNSNRFAAGDAAITDAPVLTTPQNILSATVTLTAAAFSVAFTVTPLAAGTRLFAYTSLQRSAGRSYEGDLRLVSVSTAALASPMVLTTPYTSRFGVPVVSNRIFMRFRTYTGGFLSGPFDISQVVA